MKNTAAHIYSILEKVTDPEIPVLSILDLGIVRDVIVNQEDIEVVITPTYSGCPAMDAIAMDIKFKLVEEGYKKVTVTHTLNPTWTTNWMTDAGKKKLLAYGIAPPASSKSDQPFSRIQTLLFGEDTKVTCPQCQSLNTKMLSQFGSTACKALYQCGDCKEPFDYFKCH